MIPQDDFERFYRDTLPRLESFVARLASSRAIAEDVVQETYYRFLRAAFPGATDEERRRYLYRIAVNLMKNQWARAREHEVLGEEIASRDSSARLDVADILRRMSSRDRALLWLAYAEGYSHREIGEVMGVGTMSVRVLLSRARKRFASMMEST